MLGQGKPAGHFQVRFPLPRCHVARAEVRGVLLLHTPAALLAGRLRQVASPCYLEACRRLWAVVGGVHESRGATQIDRKIVWRSSSLAGFRAGLRDAAVLSRIALSRKVPAQNRELWVHGSFTLVLLPRSLQGVAGGN